VTGSVAQNQLLAAQSGYISAFPEEDSTKRLRGGHRRWPTVQIKAGVIIRAEWVSLPAKERAGLTTGEPFTNQLTSGRKGP